MAALANNLLPLQISINLEGWSLRQSRDNHPAFKMIKNKILSRDNNHCRFCDYTGPDIGIVNLNGNYHDNKTSNLVTACSMCTNCLFIGSYQQGNKDFIDKIIYLPEISQARVNQLLRVLFVRIHQKGDMGENAQILYRSLRFRSRKVDEIFGENISDANAFAQLSFDSHIATHRNFSEVMSNLRLLPSRNTFSKEVPIWLNKYSKKPL